MSRRQITLGEQVPDDLVPQQVITFAGQLRMMQVGERRFMSEPLKSSSTGSYNSLLKPMHFWFRTATDGRPYVERDR